jgi:signal transduction histidine kinase
MKEEKKIRVEFTILIVCILLAIGYIIHAVDKYTESKESDIKILVNEATNNINSITTIYNSHLQLIQRRAEELLTEDFKDAITIKKRLIDVPNKGWELQPNEKDTITSVGRITGLGIANDISTKEIKEIYMAEKLNKFFAQTKVNLPNAPFIYYTSKTNFWNLTPRHIADFSFFAKDYINYELYTLGLPKNNPHRDIFWTKPYLDAGGNGIMVSAGVPLYYQNEFKGTICIDMMFLDIAKYLKSNMFSNQNISLIDNYNQVVSSTISCLATPDTISALNNLIGDKRNNIGLFELNKFTWHNKKRIYVSKVPNTQWYILHYEERSTYVFDILSHVLSVLVSVMLFLVIIYLLLYTNRLRIENENAKIKAENANSTKDKFLSIIAHDLRGPFSSILGFSDLIYENSSSNNTEQQRDYIEIIHGEIQTFYKLLENLLVWVQLQKEGINYTPVELTLFETADETLEPLKQLAQNKSIHIFNKIPDNFKVISDKSVLDTIIRNLVSNAIKFTAKGGKIIVGATIKNQQAEIYVNDDGTGISREKLNELFDISKKTTTKGTEGESGTGLGLLLCKEFVELQKGKIWVDSEVGKGTTFYFSIPLKG